MSNTAKSGVFWRIIAAFASHPKSDAKFRAADENPKARNKPVHYWAVHGMIARLQGTAVLVTRDVVHLCGFNR